MSDIQKTQILRNSRVLVKTNSGSIKEGIVIDAHKDCVKIKFIVFKWIYYTKWYSLSKNNSYEIIFKSI